MDTKPQNAPLVMPKSDLSFPEKVMMFWGRIFKAILPAFMIRAFMVFDRRVEGAISFFIKNYGKTKFMISMSKKAQVLGIEKLWLKSPKAFVYFFLYYLIRDSILYIIIPIYLASKL